VQRLADERRYLATIEAETYEDLARGALRARKNPPEQPEPLSQLAVDDEIFSSFRVSETARFCLPWPATTCAWPELRSTLASSSRSPTSLCCEGPSLLPLRRYGS